MSMLAAMFSLPLSKQLIQITYQIKVSVCKPLVPLQVTQLYVLFLWNEKLEGKRNQEPKYNNYQCHNLKQKYTAEYTKTSIDVLSYPKHWFVFDSDLIRAVSKPHQKSPHTAEHQNIGNQSKAVPIIIIVT